MAQNADMITLSKNVLEIVFSNYSDDMKKNIKHAETLKLILIWDRLILRFPAAVVCSMSNSFQSILLSDAIVLKSTQIITRKHTLMLMPMCTLFISCVNFTYYAHAIIIKAKAASKSNNVIIVLLFGLSSSHMHV